MARQRFFPRNRGDQPSWYHNFAFALNDLAPGLGLPPAEVASTVADALFLAYCTREYGPQAKAFAKAATVAVRSAASAKAPGPLALPTFVAPPLPDAVGALPAVVPVPAGAHQRIMRFVMLIKARPECTDAMCRQMGIIGAGEAAAAVVPEFTLAAMTAPQGQHVRVRFKKLGRKGVVVYSRRAGGDWEMLGVDMTSPFVDKRPLLVAGQPETREYRLRFFENDGPAGEYSPVAGITIGV